MQPGQVPCVVAFRKSQREVTVPPGEVLLEVAEAHGIPLDSLCRGRTCGTCRARLIAGSPRLESLYALRKFEREEGWILTCCARTVAGQRIVLDL